MPKRSIQPEDILKMHFVSDVQLSPCATKILFGKSQVDEKNKYLNHLFCINTDGSDMVQLTSGSKGAGSGRWSPCGQKIAFISGREGARGQIYLMPTGIGEAKQLTKLEEGAIKDIKWSPNGKYIAFQFRPTHPDRTQKATKEREEKGLSKPAWEIETLWYRLDGDGFFGQQRFAIWIVDTETGESKQLYDKCPVDFYSFDWLKDSSGIVVAHSANRDQFGSKSNDQMWLVPLKGKRTKIDGLPKGGVSQLTISPDGKQIAYLGFEEEVDPWGAQNSRLFVVDLTGKNWKCLTPKDDLCFETATLSDTSCGGEQVISWSKDSKKIRLTASFEGQAQVGEVSVSKGGIQIVTSGKQFLGVGAWDSSSGTQVLTKSTLTQLNEVAVLDKAGKIKQLTNFNKEWLSEVEICKPKSFWVESTDGIKVQAWVMRPIGKKKSPGILEVHGGPHTQYGYGFFHEFQFLVAQGYTVVFSNPRGSKGYGEAFCRAISGDWGNKDWDDVQAVTNWMKNDPEITTTRIGIMGGSYGGYMTNWAIGHSQDYKAAITDRCVSNWVSMAGNSDFPLNRQEYFGGYSYGDINKIKEMWRQSPLAYFDQVKTPTLVIHSEGDFRCNVEQAEQVFFALQAQKIPSRFVRYPIETSHGMSRNGPPDMRIHRLNEISSWWKSYL